MNLYRVEFRQSNDDTNDVAYVYIKGGHEAAETAIREKYENTVYIYESTMIASNDNNYHVPELIVVDP